MTSKAYDMNDQNDNVGESCVPTAATDQPVPRDCSWVAFIWPQHTFIDVFLDRAADTGGEQPELRSLSSSCHRTVTNSDLTSGTQLVFLLRLHVQVFAASIGGYSQRGRAPRGPAVLLEQQLHIETLFSELVNE